MKFDKIIRNLVQTIIWVFLSGSLLHAQNTDMVLIEALGQPVFGQTAIITTEAGEDITGMITESQSNTWLNIRSTGKINSNNHDYEVWVRAINLPAGVTLEVIRANSGNKPGGGGGQGQLIGGDISYLAITDVPQKFFTGKGDRENVGLLFQLRNVSVVQPVGNLGYHLIFEVIRL